MITTKSFKKCVATKSRRMTANLPRPKNVDTPRKAKPKPVNVLPETNHPVEVTHRKRPQDLANGLVAPTTTRTRRWTPTINGGTATPAVPALAPLREVRQSPHPLLLQRPQAPPPCLPRPRREAWLLLEGVRLPPLPPLLGAGG